MSAAVHITTTTGAPLPPVLSVVPSSADNTREAGAVVSVGAVFVSAETGRGTAGAKGVTVAVSAAWVKDR